MAKVAQAFSPKSWKVYIVSDDTDSGATGIATAGMFQLDVDSIGFPSLNPTQSLDVRSGAGRTLKDEDFFQDNILRVPEFQLSGIMHHDTGHALMAQNICNDVTTDIAVASGESGSSHLYGAGKTLTNTASSLTVVFEPSDVTNQQQMEFFGCVVTAFSLSAESNTDGGQYKWSATFQTGKKPDLASTATLTTPAAYVNTNIPLLSASSAHQVFAVDVVLSSFSVNIESPAVFTGVAADGYESVSRGAEIAVTADAQVKYDGNTKGFINSYDTQTAAKIAAMFTIVNNDNWGVAIANGVFTNVALAEGDIMMLDCSIKAVDNGTDDLIVFDVSA